MTLTALAEVLGVAEIPATYHAVFERFQSEWTTVQKQPILDWSLYDRLVEEEFIVPAGRKDLEICLQKIQEDEALHFALQFVYYALCEYRGPHENELYIDPAPPALGVYRFTFPMLILTKCFIKGVVEAKRRGIPEESLSELRGAVNGDYLESEGVYGTPNMFHWRVVCAFGTMFHAGAFRYEPERVPEGYRMLRRRADGKLLMLYTAARDIDEYGQFAFAKEQIAFSTTTATGKTDGFVIAPDGRVMNHYVDLSEEEWEIAFDGGDMALSFHIPSGIPYNVTAAMESFRKAAAFYQTYFPEMPIRSIQSYSWLYSPQLTAMLPRESGINRLNRELYLAPVPSGPDGFYSFVFKIGADDFDVETVETDTSLKRGFVRFVKDGGRVHNGFMYFPLQDVERFSENAHELYAWDMIKG